MANLSAGYTFGSSETVTNTKLGTLVTGGSVNNIVNADIASGAAITYSKLNLTGNISDSDISTMAAIEYSKLSLGASIQTTDISSGSGLIPSGGIIMWSGAISAIPSGWYLCNGSNSTPDLRDRFVLCADADSGGTYNVGATGNGTLPATNVTIGPYGNYGTSGSSFGTAIPTDGASTGAITATFGTGTTVIATYYALAFLMKS